MKLWQNFAKKRALRQLDRGDPLACAEDFADCAELAKRYVVCHRNWYRQRAKWVRWFFRVSGGGVILLSAVLPIVAFLGFPHVRLVITVLSVCIATLTALRSFFQWDLQWRVLKQADWKITGLLASWEADICGLKSHPSGQRDRLASEATKTLIDHVNAVVQDESTTFFRAVQWPKSGVHEDAPATAATG
jgi:hypothetical protein